MRVAIIGSGGIGRGYVAYLTSQGHHPILWSPSGAAQADFTDTATLDVTGQLETSFQPAISRNCAEAVEGAEAIIVAVPANGFRAVLDLLVPHLTNDQTVIISSHCSFAALYLHRQLTQRGLDLPVVAWATTALTARKSGPRSVHISGVRSKLDVATLPIRHAATGLSVCRRLFGDRFEQRQDILAIMLSNLNPPGHMANMLGNLTRAERGEDWPNYGSITQGVGRIIDAMDVERLAWLVPSVSRCAAYRSTMCTRLVSSLAQSIRWRRRSTGSGLNCSAPRRSTPASSRRTYPLGSFHSKRWV